MLPDTGIGDALSFAEDVRELFRRTRDRTEALVAPLNAEDMLLQSMEGRQPGEVASGAYDLVFRGVRPAAILPGLSITGRPVRGSVQFLLYAGRSAPRA